MSVLTGQARPGRTVMCRCHEKHFPCDIALTTGSLMRKCLTMKIWDWKIQLVCGVDGGGWGEREEPVKSNAEFYPLEGQSQDVFFERYSMG